MSELPEFVEKLLKDVIKSEGFTDYTVDYQPGSKHGDNYLGVMTSVTVSGTRNKKGHLVIDQLHLVCKLAPATEARRKEFKSFIVFEREALMYNKILPLFAEFQREKGLSKDEAFTAYPKCYVAIADEATDRLVVIMEDIRPKGFVMYPRNEPTTAENAFKLVEQLGRLHGISFALKDQRPEVYKSFNALTDVICEVFLSSNFTKSLSLSYDRAIASLTNEKHIEILRDVKANMSQYLQDTLTDCVWGEYGVIGHGDTHNNNILYKYDNGVSWFLNRARATSIVFHHF